jgi:ATP synthase protein I
LRLVGLGWFVGLSIGLGIWGGRQLDGNLGTSPLLVIVGLVAGVVIAFYGVYRMIVPNIKRQAGRGK